MTKIGRGLFLLCATAALVSCSPETSAVSDPHEQNDLSKPQIDYSKKIEIIERVKTPESVLSILISKLESEWPTLFAAQTENELLQKYSFITWHIDSEAQERLQKNLSNLHPEYVEYAKLLKEGVLPAEHCVVTKLSIDRYSGEEVAVTAQYELHLKNGQKKHLTVSLTANANFEKFNPRFNTSEGKPLDSAGSEQQELAREFIFSALTNDEIRKLKIEELYELFKQ